jgi:hypothetical protein
LAIVFCRFASASTVTGITDACKNQGKPLSRVCVKPCVLPTSGVKRCPQGFHKILKKHDKKLPSAPVYRFYSGRLHQRPWVAGNQSDFLVGLSRVFSILRGDTTGKKSEDAAQVKTRRNQLHVKVFVRICSNQCVDALVCYCRRNEIDERIRICPSSAGTAPPLMMDASSTTILPKLDAAVSRLIAMDFVLVYRCVCPIWHAEWDI